MKLRRTLLSWIERALTPACARGPHNPYWFIDKRHRLERAASLRDIVRALRKGHLCLALAMYMHQRENGLGGGDCLARDTFARLLWMTDPDVPVQLTYEGASMGRLWP